VDLSPERDGRWKRERSMAFRPPLGNSSIALKCWKNQGFGGGTHRLAKAQNVII
jgi:hypothetical protein